jgi:SAM-dependent methyltransferase
LALKETSRILKHGGWFVCMWNHRILEDPIQKNIEDIIKTKLGDYNYGSRREDQTKVIEESGLFGKVEKVEQEMMHSQTVVDCIEAWRSHATLERQAGYEFSVIINNIEDYLNSLHKKVSRYHI